jgi:hypothetical protein
MLYNQLVHMHSGLYHSAVSNCQVNHNPCLLQYSLDLWSMDSLHIHDRALFDSHQTPNLDSNDRKFHCDSPPGYDFEQCTMAMRSSILSAILLEGTLMQIIYFHLNNSLFTIYTQKAFTTRCTSSNPCM